MSDTNQTGIKAVIKREIGIIISRPIYLTMILIIPLFSYVFFITLLNKGLPDKMPVAVVDLDNSSTSRLLIRQIDATQQSRVVGKLNSYHEAIRQMQEGTIYAFMVIPEDFQAKVFTGKQPDVPFYIQNAYYVAGALLMKDIALTVATVSGGVNLKMRLAKGQSENEAMAQILPVNVDINEIGNAWTNYSVYLSTLMLPGILQIMILIVTIYSIGIELKFKTSRKWLLVADKSIVKALVGKLLPYSIIFILLALVGNIILFKYLGFPFIGSTWEMAFGTILFVLAQQGLGILLISLLPVLRDGLSLAAIFGTLSISFSGLTFPVEGMYSFVHAWSTVFPLRHYFLIYVSQALTGGGIAASWLSYMALVAFIVLPVFLLVRLKKALVYQNYKPD